MSLSRPPGPGNILLRTNTLNLRSRTLKNCRADIRLGSRNLSQGVKGLGEGPHRHSKIHIQNAQMMLLESKRLRPASVQDLNNLWHLFKNEYASPKSRQDLLTCRQIGKRLAKSFVSVVILGQPSMQQRPLKKQFLRPFEPKKHKSKKAKGIKKAAARKSQWIWKNHLEAARKNQESDIAFTVTNTIPLALFDVNGYMRKSSKSDFNRHLVEKDFPKTLSNRHPITDA
jgi:hypothetical protein